ncbi:hypothetical protein FQA39_LY15858 [Lamprigera yunnana]|nr:hypothetical protein FQA39_LY15858 [Lamprigera yunnana]
MSERLLCVFVGEVEYLSGVWIEPPLCFWCNDLTPDWRPRYRRFSNVADVVLDDFVSHDTDNIIDASDDLDCTIENEEETTKTSTNKEHENKPGLLIADKDFKSPKTSKRKCDTIPEIFKAFVEEKKKRTADREVLPSNI